MTSTPEQIAGKLTAEERRYFLASTQEPRCMSGFGVRWTHPELVRPVGVNHPIFGSHYELTTLGLAVRDAIERGG